MFQPRGAGQGAGEPWQQRIQRDGTKLRLFPLPTELPDLASSIQRTIDERVRVSDIIRPGETPPSAQELEQAGAEYVADEAALIALQEQLDWECYRIYGLIEASPVCADGVEPPLRLGERAFEIRLARRVKLHEEETSWFVRHGSTPVTELPSHWSADYRRVVEERIDLIDQHPSISVIERPEFKRRWASDSWEDQVEMACRLWLLNRLEDGRYWPNPAAVTTVARLTTEARADEDFVAAARLYSGREDVDLGAVVAELVRCESVPYLAALRYTNDGLRKHSEWVRTWDLQRKEDDGAEVGVIPAPPKFVKADFTGVGWEHRGKLDVPKERFICYPGAERETDASLVVGWAGWNHLDRARALAAWYLQARRDGREAAHLTPLLAGLAELVPWLKQWYDEPSTDAALDRPGTQIAALVEGELRSLSLTAEDLDAWRPEQKRAGRKRKAAQ